AKGERQPSLAAGHEPRCRRHRERCRNSTHKFAAAGSSSARAAGRWGFVDPRDHWNYCRYPDHPFHPLARHPVLASFFSGLRWTRRRFRGRRRLRWWWRVRRLWWGQFWWRRGKQQLVAREDTMVPEDKIDDFVKRVREAAGSNLESVLLFGSAVSGDFHPGLSNLNLLCVLRDCSFAVLQALAPVAKWWDRQKKPPPLCMTRKELERSTDVFTVELLDMQQHHRVLFGEDVVQELRISMHVHRVQVEYELREKLILLRQQVLLAAGSDSRLWDLVLHSVPSFGTLFRHALIALGDASQSSRRAAVDTLSKRVGFDLSAVHQALDV